MTSAAFNKIAAGMAAAIDYAEGKANPDEFVVHIPETVDVKAIRKRLHLSQPRFAECFGFSVGRIRDWEQGRSPVDAPSRVLLTVIEREPEAVKRALHASGERISAYSRNYGYYSPPRRHGAHGSRVLEITEGSAKPASSSPKRSGRTGRIEADR